ncbi:cysteine desulfurase [Bradyrhizobium sp. 168]|jgi:cysteine desulfurase|uniref:cysteine desulfurase family protein n=1 Tax=unclassified Bradyrhizobium TaxID=2631580 RepID=UPI001FFB7004|nr:MULTISPECIES: cysteine desulfurase family protein [unclassified Bradyrhizobium]MCK1346243.1 cysteine desulfurase [Bradyrhizobium sp. CW11]MCK1468004.1 cysteine desulfurase [Bradyrhizobium sp. CW10]MCK1582638.1 cysteine desulfurase [Bradyrhizobium sp. 168]MCK1588438.1 cysteine desulfurase [Bradyrhizobium sp. 169]UPK08668.1 cysteine desulfurase [Bradyrhizobium sp. 155]
MPSRIYLDWNATTPLRAEARSAMLAASELIGNPSSVHAEGREARRLVEDARALLATSVGALPRNAVFTSTGTEANALALSPGLRGPSGGPVERLLVSAVEHASVLAGGRFPTDQIGQIRVTRSGVIDLDHLKALLGDGPPALVSIMAANNETGALQPIAEAAGIVHGAGGLLHVDAIQSFGKISFDIKVIGADLATFSAHKIGGPKGVGALVVAEGVAGLEPLLRGGGQELNRRAGTENVAGIAGFGAAVRVALQALPEDAERMASLRDRLENGIRSMAGATVFSSDVGRLPNTVLFTAPGLKAETAVIGFDLEGVAVSSGSACSSGKVQPSHVLSAMGYDPTVAQGAVRLSLGWSTEPDDINRALEAWRKLGNTLLKG